MYYNRIAEDLTKKYLELFPVVGVMGPRQSGKSTMLKRLFGKEYTYLTFDDFELKELFYNDPKRFISRYSRKIIFDEAQQIPELFPLIKQVVDNDRLNYGNFILTGSGQFLMGRHISESLAGRIGLVPLMPLQFCEMPVNRRKQAVFSGGFPELVVRNWEGRQAWYSGYLETYIQKDLRQMTNISDLHAFTMFLRILAANVTHTINLSVISRDIGISVATLSRWLSVLESSYIIFLLQPYYRNLGKRLVKSPKIYFMDTGLLSFLTGIQTLEQWEGGILFGPVFENFVISELLKHIYHSGQDARMFFYRTNHGDEIDIVLEYDNRTDIVEIKASETYRPGFHKILAKTDFGKGMKQVVYQGKTGRILNDIVAINFAEYLINPLRGADEVI